MDVRPRTTVRHRASEVRCRLDNLQRLLEIAIIDDGKGQEQETSRNSAGGL